jgi:hypothetical protein
METDTHFEAFFNTSFSVPSRVVLLPGRPHAVPSERDVPFLEHSFIHHSQSPVYRSPILLILGSLGCKVAPVERDARIRMFLV